MTQEKMDRISELYRKSKNEGLTPEEQAEQKALRNEYRAAVRGSLAGHLENTYIAEPDGTTRKITQKKG